MSTLDDMAGRYGILDSRSIIERIDALESIETRDDWENAELAELIAARDEIEPDCSDWQYGEMIIAEWAFEDYARELADDIGAINTDSAWPASFIDWSAAADALKQDYTSADIDGTTWYYR